MDQKDLLILSLLHQNPGASLGELREAILVRSIAAVYYRVKSLEEAGFIAPPPHKKMARSRRITKLGELLLHENHLL